MNQTRDVDILKMVVLVPATKYGSCRTSVTLRLPEAKIIGTHTCIGGVYNDGFPQIFKPNIILLAPGSKTITFAFSNKIPTNPLSIIIDIQRAIVTEVLNFDLVHRQRRFGAG